MRAVASRDGRLTEELACNIMGWRTGPGRFLKPGGGWTPRWRFAPLTNLEQAFGLLDRAASAYTISANKIRGFQVEVRVGGRVGKASGKPKSRVITIALCHALGLALPDEVSGTTSKPVVRAFRLEVDK